MRPRALNGAVRPRECNHHKQPMAQGDVPFAQLRREIDAGYRWYLRHHKPKPSPSLRVIDLREQKGTNP